MLNMKKTIVFLFLVSAICLSPNFATSVYSQNKDGQRRETIILTQTKDYSENIPRSLPYVSIAAILDTSMDQIEISFDEPEGRAIIQVACMGQVINSYSCNTEEEWVVYLPAPVYPGEYSLIIKTSVAEYIGYFSL